MSEINYSPIASLVANARSPTKTPNDRGTPFGLLVHTSGGGVTDVARKQKLTPLQVALRVYIDAQNGGNGYPWGGPTYVVPHDGAIWQIAPDNLRTEHAGGPNRWRYIDGSWEHVYPVVTDAWKRQWGNVKSAGGRTFKHPYQLFPSTSPNRDYVGVEMIPCGDGYGTPMAPGLRFSYEQHNAIRRLGRDLAARHAWPKGWQKGCRLVGHEDVDPLERSWSSGGWDPGFLRPDPFFDFALVRASI